jgi:hypothetical protein
MKKFETKRLFVNAIKFDTYRKPWPHGVETVVGDIGVPHPVIIGTQGNTNLNHGDWIIYMPLGEVVMGDELFHALFQEHTFQPGLFAEDGTNPPPRVQPLDPTIETMLKDLAKDTGVGVTRA